MHRNGMEVNAVSLFEVSVCNFEGQFNVYGGRVLGEILNPWKL